MHTLVLGWQEEEKGSMPIKRMMLCQHDISILCFLSFMQAIR